MILLLVLSLLFAQSPAPTTSVVQKSQEIIDHAIETLGGQKYLGVKTVIGKGFYTSYHDGMSQIPARFVDYLEYPVRERTEFTDSGQRVAANPLSAVLSWGGRQLALSAY